MADVETPQLEVVELPDVEEAVRGTEPLPDALPILPLRETVTYPDTLTPLAVGQERSIKLVNDVLSGDRMLAMVASKDPELDAPGPDDLYRVGVVGTVARMMKIPDGTLGSWPRSTRIGSSTTSASSPAWWRGSRRCRM
jgi:ATP-dependent Lon protease